MYIPKSEAIGIITKYRNISAAKLCKIVYSYSDEQIAREIIKTFKLSTGKPSRFKTTFKQVKDQIKGYYEKQGELPDLVIGFKRAVISTKINVVKFELGAAFTPWIKGVPALVNFAVKKFQSKFSDKEASDNKDREFKVSLAGTNFRNKSYSMVVAFNKRMFPRLIPSKNIGNQSVLKTRGDIEEYNRVKTLLTEKLTAPGQTVTFNEVKGEDGYTSKEGCCMGAVIEVLTGGADTAAKKKVVSGYEEGVTARAAAYQIAVDSLIFTSEQTKESNVVLRKVVTAIGDPGLKQDFESYEKYKQDSSALDSKKNATSALVNDPFNDPNEKDTVNQKLEKQTAFEIRKPLALDAMKAVLTVLEEGADKDAIEKIFDNAKKQFGYEGTLDELKSVIKKCADDKEFPEKTDDNVKKIKTALLFTKEIFKKQIDKRNKSFGFEGIKALETAVQGKLIPGGMKEDVEAVITLIKAPPISINKSELDEDRLRNNLTGILNIDKSGEEALVFQALGKKLVATSCDGSQLDSVVLEKIKKLEDGSYSIGINSDQGGRHAIAMVVDGDNSFVFDPNIGCILCKKEELPNVFVKVLSWYPRVKNHNVIINQVLDVPTPT